MKCKGWNSKNWKTTKMWKVSYDQFNANNIDTRTQSNEEEKNIYLQRN